MTRRKVTLGVISTPWSNGPQLHGGEIFLRTLAFARDDGLGPSLGVFARVISFPIL